MCVDISFLPRLSSIFQVLTFIPGGGVCGVWGVCGGWGGGGWGGGGWGGCGDGGGDGGGGGGGGGLGDSGLYTVLHSPASVT